MSLRAISGRWHVPARGIDPGGSLPAVLVAVSLAIPGSAGADQLLGARGGVEIWSVPQPSPGPCFVAARIEARAGDPGARLVTFEGLAFRGRFVQLWQPALEGPPRSTPKSPLPDSYPVEWAPYDSRLLIEPSMVGGGAGGGYSGIDETNDGSLTPIDGLPRLFSRDPPAGFGEISMDLVSDAFFLNAPFQTDTVALAYLVAGAGDATGGQLTMSLGVLGEGITNSGEPDGAQWGGGENPQPLTVSFSTDHLRSSGFRIGARGGVEVWNIPRPSPGPGFVAAEIELRAVDPRARLVTFEDLEFAGELVQVWLPTLGGRDVSTPKAPWPATYPGEWAPFDSRILIEPSMVGGGAGAGYSGIDESNDRSLTPIKGLPQAFGKDAPAGVGGIAMEDSSDAFFLGTSFQAHTVRLAYLVATRNAAENGRLSMSLGVLGERVVNSGQPDGAQWGGRENPKPLTIPFFPEPGPPSRFLLGRRGSVEVWSVPQPPPADGYVATRIEFLTSDPGAKVVTFEGLAFGGKFVHVWLPRLLGLPIPTPTDPWPSEYPAEWAPFDSRVLIEASMVGGGVGASYDGIEETNDQTIGAIKGLPPIFGLDSVAGLGSLAMRAPTDAFFLNAASQTNRIAVAHLVARTADARAGGFTMSVGVLGEGIRNSGALGGAQWGLDENPDPLAIAFAPDSGAGLPPPGIRAVPGGIELSFTGWPGRFHALQYSENLVTWRTIAMDLCGEVRFTDRDATRTARMSGFYRAFEQ